MEGTVGILWHKLISRAADQRYPQAAVELSEISKTAGIFFRALGGDSGLDIRAAAATEYGARRSLLQRIAGSGEKIELAWLDEDMLRLPGVFDLLPQRSLNRDLYLWLIALAAENPHGASWVVRSQQATLSVLDRFPGMRSRYQRLIEAIMMLRPDPARLPEDEAALERAIRAALQNPGSVEKLPRAGQPPYPVHLWLHPDPPRHLPSQAAAMPAGETQQEGDGKSKKDKDARHRRAERVDMPDNKNPLMLFFRAESIFSWAEYVKVNRATEEEEDYGADRAADDIDRLSVAQDGKRAASRLRFDLDLPSAAQDDRPLGPGILLPEWDYRKQRLQSDYCCVQPVVAHAAEPCPLPAHLAATARRIRSQFEALVPERVWFRGQFDGTEPDLDACVQFAADRLVGHATERGLYRAHRNRDRDLACLMLADLSLSTDAWINDSSRVIDIIRDSLYLFAEALSATGDRFGMYGFSSLRRDNVRFHVIKEFGEQYNAGVRSRIAAIKPGYYTRMGAAIRHASRILSKQPSAQRILLLLTDGKPNDLDQYEGRYGIEDTRIALVEARQMGLHPFCVTIDEKANNYLPHLFGIGGYAVIHKPSELPKQLPLLYAQLTR